MQFQSLIIAFAAASLAGAQDINSIVSVLQTAIPSSVIQQFQTDQAGFVSSVESQARAGETPSWFQDLPSDVKSFLGIAATGTLTGDLPEETGGDDSTQSSGNDVTVTGTTDSPTGTGAGAVAMTTSTAGGGAAPTQIVGMGLAGAMGLVGLMVL